MHSTCHVIMFSNTSKRNLILEAGEFEFIGGKKAPKHPQRSLKLLLQDKPYFCWQCACSEANYESL